MLQGLSLTKALDSLRKAVKASCASCGGLLKHSRRDAIFCHNTPRCRKAIRRYKYLVYDKKQSKAEALATVLESLNGSTE